MTLSVSILINNYNYARYLGEAIDSALAQTVPACEVIVVDDGSTDNSRDVIAGYGNSIRSIIQDNRGQAGAYNAGFRESKGDLVLFLDADDIIDSDFVEQISKAWKPGAAKLHIPMRVLASRPVDGLSDIVPSQHLSSGYLLDEILRFGFYTSSPGSGNVYSREVLNKILPMREGAFFAADTVTIYLSALYGQVLAVSRPLGTYRMHGDNHTGTGIANSKNIRRSLQNDMDRMEILKSGFMNLGIVFDGRCINRDFRHLKMRISSLRLDPDKHPFEEDRKLRLALSGINAVARTNRISILRRIYFSFWFLLMAFVPNRLVHFLVTIGCCPAARPRILMEMYRMRRS
jgi:glycosyltransferase involved in cell wall biosynthesis